MPDFSKADLTRLEAAMRELVRQNVAFVRETVPLQEAIDYFVSAGEDDKVRLLKYRKRNDLVLYRVGEIRDYHHGYMVPLLRLPQVVRAGDAEWRFYSALPAPACPLRTAADDQLPDR